MLLVAPRFLNKNGEINLLLCLIAAFGLYCAINYQYSQQYYWKTVDFIRSYGYDAETHIITTPDGYQLEIHRIPHNRRRNVTSGKPVLLQHGFICTSVIWVLQGPQKDLAFLLSDEGYDVWLLNTRGSSYTKLNPSATIAYNDFSFHEMGVLDLPASIDYILNVTQHENVTLIGHSMGTTLTFAGLSILQQLNSKINFFVALAPITHREHFSVFIHRQIEYSFITSSFFNLGELVDATRLLRKTPERQFLLSIIPSFLWTPFFKIYFKHLAGGETQCNIQIPYNVMVTHLPDSTVYTTLTHFHQNIMQDKFQWRDWGLEKNQRLYNATTPPEYNLKNVKVPMSAYCGEADAITPFPHFRKQLKKFGTNIKIHKLPGFHHFDLIWSTEAVSRVFPQILRDIQSATTTSIQYNDWDLPKSITTNP